MMRLFVVTLVVAAALCASSADAQPYYGWDHFWHGVGTDFKRMNHYPEPFVYADREATRLPFRIMVANGWRLQNTLGSHYFHPETQQLTRAGELKVQWIVTQAPERYRTVHVLRAGDTDVTGVRVDSVQQTIARLLPNGPMPPVVETGSEVRGFPGDYVDDTYRKAQTSQPAPVLPAASGESN